MTVYLIDPSQYLDALQTVPMLLLGADSCIAPRNPGFVESQMLLRGFGGQGGTSSDFIPSTRGSGPLARPCIDQRSSQCGGYREAMKLNGVAIRRTGLCHQSELVGSVTYTPLQRMSLPSLINIFGPKCDKSFKSSPASDPGFAAQHRVLLFLSVEQCFARAAGHRAALHPGVGYLHAGYDRVRERTNFVRSGA